MASLLLTAIPAFAEPIEIQVFDEQKMPIERQVHPFSDPDYKPVFGTTEAKGMTIFDQCVKERASCGNGTHRRATRFLMGETTGA